MLSYGTKSSRPYTSSKKYDNHGRNSPTIIAFVASLSRSSLRSPLVRLPSDWDTSHTQRTSIPAFYGYVPNKAAARAACFLSMISLTFSHVLLKTFSCALLAVIGRNWLMYYICADIGLFSLYKIATKDFHYYAIFQGVIRYLVTLASRVGNKIMVDFTLFFQMRNPCEPGGFMFVISLLESLAVGFVSVFMYAKYYGEDDAKALYRMRSLPYTRFGCFPQLHFSPSSRENTSQHFTRSIRQATTTRNSFWLQETTKTT